MSYFQNSLKDSIPGVFMRWIGAGRRPRQSGPPAVFRLLATWTTRARVRLQLAQLDERHLRDIGISLIEVRREIIKPFWSE